MKSEKLEVRLTPVEKRALQRLARHENKTLAELVRVRVINPALNFDPRQRAFSFEKGGHGHERTG